MEELRKKQKTVIIGIMGIHSGAGVTTMSVAMANYMSAFLRKSTALSEYNDSRDFLKMREMCGDNRDYSQNSTKFSYKKNDFYPCGSTDIISLGNGGYDVVIIDFGADLSAMEEFSRCHHRIIMSSLEPWRYGCYEKFCERIKAYGGSDSWLHILHGAVADINGVSHRFGTYSVKRPVIDNPFIINATLIEFFETLF